MMHRTVFIIFLSVLLLFGAFGTWLVIDNRTMPRVLHDSQSRAIGGPGADNPDFHPWVVFKNYTSSPSNPETGGFYFNSAEKAMYLYYDAAWNEIGNDAPTDATYITQTADDTLSAEQALSALATGLVKVTTGTGVLSTATAGSDYVATETDPNALLTAGTDNVKDTHIDWGSGASQVDMDDLSDGSTNAAVTLTQESNWDTAYGWGDHGEAGYESDTHASEHAVGGADTVFPADPNADKYLMWDDDPGQLSWEDAAGGGGISIGDSVGSGTSGSVLFVDASTQLAQDNANFFWDNTNKRLGINTNASPSNTLHARATIDGAAKFLFENLDGGAAETTQTAGIYFSLADGTTLRDAAAFLATKDNDYTSAAAADGGLLFQSTFNGALTDRFFINSDGKVNFINRFTGGSITSKAAVQIDSAYYSSTPFLTLRNNGDSTDFLSIDLNNGPYILYDDSDNLSFGVSSIYYANSGSATIRATLTAAGRWGIGVTDPDTLLDVNGAITYRELSADPSDPDEGSTVCWQSDGTGTGDDGDRVCKTTAGGSTKTWIDVDFSALP